MEIKELLNAISKDTKCVVFPSSGQPVLPQANLKLPEDLELFYNLCGGISFFAEESFPMEIVTPENLVRANPIIAGVEGENDISYNWFVIGQSDNSQYITINLSSTCNGFCYDSFWDRYGLVGEMPVIAKSFTDLLNNLYTAKGKQLYWLEGNFEYLGDAYDE